MIHVLAEQSTLDGSQRCAGVSARVRDYARRISAQGRQDGQAQAAARAHRYQPGSGLPPDGGDDGVRAVAGFDVSVAGVR